MIQKRPSVLGGGTVSLDTVESGGEVARDVLGGSAPYFAAAARVSADVALVGVVGEDFPERFVTLLSEAGIDVSGIDYAYWLMLGNSNLNGMTAALAISAWGGVYTFLSRFVKTRSQLLG